MSVWLLVLAIIIVGGIGFLIAFARARAIEAKGQKMHSRPAYYGWWTALIAVIPALVFLALWDIGSAVYLEHHAASQIPALDDSGAPVNQSLALSTIRNIKPYAMLLSDKALSGDYKTVREEVTAMGHALPEQGDKTMVQIAFDWAQDAYNAKMIGAVIAAIMALIGCIIGIAGVGQRKRARNKVERVITGALILASVVAILTTIGIVFSMLFQTIEFFKSVSPWNFFFGTVWDPRFSSAGSGGEVGQFGLIPLLAGTLYIAFVAMLFAVPVGLFAAIYMSEYASSRVRAIIKPLLEVLAGIPTIVYGFFALMTVGPFLRDISKALSGGHELIQAQSVLTAGLVMGIMLIPFVSSLSDDIINAVPNSLRDGSYGLGATQSETIKRVVLPAALPGIVSALLLTASRAIGETMIVVLAAGVAANLTLNPFEPMTTMTVKIVNQLTGDLEFNSPQTLVAFALGMTLFVLTLLMNIYALYIVRKYREQYE